MKLPPILHRLFAATPPPEPPSPASLTTQQAVDQLLDLLGQYHEPDRLLQQLGKPRSELRSLLSDDEISTALETRRAAVLATDWHLDGQQAGARVVRFVHEQVVAHLPEILRQAWTAVPYGYSVIEAVYREEQGRLVWSALTAPPFEWFRPQQDGTLRFYPSYGDSSGYGELVDTEYKFFTTTRHPTVTNPHGEALLATLYWPWFFRTHGWTFWARFLERHGAPLLVGKTLRDPQEMAAALDAAVQSAVLAIGKEDEVAAVGVTNNGESFNAFSNAIDRRIQKTILGQTLTTDVGSSGSYAAAKVHNEVRMDRRLSDCTLVSSTVNRMIEALVKLNFPQGTAAPRFVMEDGKGLDEARAARDKLLCEAGMVQFTPRYIVNHYDLEETDFVIPAAAPIETPPVAATATLPYRFAASGGGSEGETLTPPQQALERLADAVLERVPQPVALAAIREAIEGATAPEEVATRLAALLPESDPKRFRQIVERALFAADVMGYVAAEEQQP